eukprot:6472400-Amphidinium_carterae.2
MGEGLSCFKRHQEPLNTDRSPLTRLPGKRQTWRRQHGHSHGGLGTLKRSKQSIETQHGTVGRWAH